MNPRWRVEVGGRRVEAGEKALKVRGWRLEGEGWRVEVGGRRVEAIASSLKPLSSILEPQTSNLYPLSSCLKPQTSILWQGGFTLLELMVVLFIMGLGLAFALPALSRGLEGLSLTAAAREVAAVYRGAREEAVARQETKLVLFTAEGERLAVRWDGRYRLLPQGIRLGAVRPETLRDAEGRIALEFYADGSSSGGDLQVEGKPDRPPLWVMVDSVTGRVRIVRGEG